MLFRSSVRLFGAVVLTAVAAGTVALPAAASSVSPKILTVPGEFPTIQKALDAAATGDTIDVSPGSYPEDITFEGKNVSLVGIGGAARTSLDPLGGTVVLIGPGGSIRGFTISGGTGSFGAGMAVSGEGSVIQQDVFSGNHEGIGGYGAAIGGDVASPLIEQSVFVGNGCDSQFLSGVVSFINASNPQIVNNVFHDNNCRAIDLSLPAGTTPIVVNNTFVRNVAGIDLGLYSPQRGQIIRNNIVVDNTVGVAASASGFSFDHNLVYGNTADYSGMADQTGKNGNISADPSFVDSIGGDFELSYGSPALGAGSALDAPAVDFDGNPRPAASIDMGAFQSQDITIATHPSVTLDATTPKGVTLPYTPPAASDPGAPVAPTVTCAPAPGSKFAIGKTVVTCTATDGDLTPVSSTFLVTVRDAAAQLSSLAEAVVGLGTAHVLVDTVARAQEAYAERQYSDACSDLQTFIFEVYGTPGSSIAPKERASLVAAAVRIESVVGCK